MMQAVVGLPLSQREAGDGEDVDVFIAFVFAFPLLAIRVPKKAQAMAGNDGYSALVGPSRLRPQYPMQCVCGRKTTATPWLNETI